MGETGRYGAQLRALKEGRWSNSRETGYLSMEEVCTGIELKQHYPGELGTIS